MDAITLTVPGTYQPLTVTSGIHASARRTPNKIALIDGARSDPSIEEPMEFCLQHLSSYKVPRDFAFIDELPRNPNGKILKRSLRDA